MSETLKQEVALRDKTHLLSDAVTPVSDELWGYEKAMTAAGVKVIAFEQFGSDQGGWWAKVRFPNGEEYFVSGYYGSCSGCDAFEAEFGWNDDKKPGYLHKLRDFGRNYLTDCYTADQAIVKASESLNWDSEAQSMVDWIKAHSTPTPLQSRK